MAVCEWPLAPAGHALSVDIQVVHVLSIEPRATAAPFRAQVLIHRPHATGVLANSESVKAAAKHGAAGQASGGGNGGGGRGGGFHTSPMCWVISNEGKGIGLSRASKVALKQAAGWRFHA